VTVLYKKGTFVKLVLLGVASLIASVGASACPLCGGTWGAVSAEEYLARYHPVVRDSSAAPAALPSPLQGPAPAPPSGLRIDRETAASAVLAVRADDGARLRVVALIRGEMPEDGTIKPSWVVGLDRDAGAKPLLLIRARKWQSWANVGPSDAESADWLRHVAALKPATETADAEWPEVFALLLPYLENKDPTIAEIAYGGLARAPYAALRSLRDRLDLQRLRHWTADPQLADRRSLYTLLVGVGGDASDTARIERQLDAAWKAKDATNLGPLLAASLELRGPSRMAWIDAKYIGDRDRTRKELDAALLALSVQGGANATIPRERVIESYRLFIDRHPSLAGFVAEDLATWNYWDAGPAYIALLRSGAEQHPASRYAMLNYLRQSPQPDAKAAVGSLAKAAQ